MNQILRLSVKVKTNSKHERFEDNIVYVNAPPIDGKANERVVALIAEYYNVSKSSVIILKGHKSKVKSIIVKL